jgi:hypothetical protein
MSGGCTLQWEIFPHEDGFGDWTVEAINFTGGGELFTAIFTASSAEDRAREYSVWKAEAVRLAA